MRRTKDSGARRETRARKENAEPDGGASKQIYLSPANPADDYMSGEDWVLVGIALNLTTRELEVAGLVFHGETRRNIARHLGLSIGGVRERIDRLFKKANVGNNLGLVVRIARVHRLLNRTRRRNHGTGAPRLP